jgi:hypothetical protein
MMATERQIQILFNTYTITENVLYLTDVLLGRQVNCANAN